MLLSERHAFCDVHKLKVSVLWPCVMQAARHALSPERQASGGGLGEQAAGGAAFPPPEQGGLGPSMRGMFSDLKRTMERVGVRPGCLLLCVVLVLGSR